MENNTTLPTQEDVTKLPKDETQQATVLSIIMEDWEKHLTQEQSNKFGDNKKDVQVFIKYETEQGFIGEDNLKHYDKPTDRTKLGKYLVKYGDFAVGQEIKILWDDKSKPTILLPV